MAGLTDYQGTAGIVSGASSGIWAQLARDLAARVMRVALLARRAGRLTALADEIQSGGGDALAHPSDAAQRASLEVAVAGKLGQPDEAAYSASKFAVTGLSEGLSYELAPLGIHVMTVHPALVRTEMFTPEVMARMPRGAERTFLEPPEFSRRVLRALERGRYEVTVPGYIGIAYLVRALLPGLFRRMTARTRLPVLPDLES